MLRAILADSSFTIPREQQTAIQKAVQMYRACNASSYGLSLNLLNEIRRIKVFMAWLNLDITNITDDPNEDALERMLQLSLQYGIHTFFFFYVDAYEYVDQKNVLRVSDCFIFPPRFS